MGWVRALGPKILGIDVRDDETPWCGTFAAHVIAHAGYTPPRIAVRASAWDRFGEPLTKPYLGAIVRFERPGGGKVSTNEA